MFNVHPLPSVSWYLFYMKMGMNDLLASFSTFSECFFGKMFNVHPLPSVFWYCFYTKMGVDDLLASFSAFSEIAHLLWVEGQ